MAGRFGVMNDNIWKKRFSNLEEIPYNKLDNHGQEYLGDYIGTEAVLDSFWDTWSDKKEYIEVKGLPPETILDSNDKLAFEMYSCRATGNPGWIYKQKNTKYLFMKNHTGIYYIDYPKLRSFWYNLYPNPVVPEYNNKFPNHWVSFKTTQRNHSEGFWILTSWLKQYGYIIQSWE
jgi:hypothetical protein